MEGAADVVGAGGAVVEVVEVVEVVDVVEVVEAAASSDPSPPAKYDTIPAATRRPPTSIMRRPNRFMVMSPR